MVRMAGVGWNGLTRSSTSSPCSRTGHHGWPFTYARDAPAAKPAAAVAAGPARVRLTRDSYLTWYPIAADGVLDGRPRVVEFPEYRQIYHGPALEPN